MTTPESAEVGGAIGRIKADDPDVGRNAEMEYSIVGGHDIFNIITDQKTQEGVIVIKKVDFLFSVDILQLNYYFTPTSLHLKQSGIKYIHESFKDTFNLCES